MVFKQRIRFLAILASLFLLTGNYLIAQECPLTIEELCNQSSDIVVVNTQNIVSYQSEDGKYVHSDIDISIENKIKGTLNKSDMIRLTMYGGTIDGNTTYVVGFPKFFKNMRSVLFLKEQQPPKGYTVPQRIFTVVGLAQGKIDVLEENGQEKLSRDYHLPLKSNSNAFILKENDNMTLNELISKINTYK